jgi:hypothetical protein
MERSNKKAGREVGNVTKERLAGTPFQTAEELKGAQAEILEETWREFERARARKQLVQKDEYRFFIETFEKGLLCKYGESNDNLVRVFLSPNGIQIAINEEMKSAENSESLLGVLVKSMSESFIASYLKAMGLIPNSETHTENEKTNRQLHSKAKKYTTGK